MSGIIPKEELAGMQRWELASFDRRPSLAPAAPPPPPAEEIVTVTESIEPVHLPTAEEIERIHDEARKAGYEAGHTEGLAQAKEKSEKANQAIETQLRQLITGLQGALAELDQQVAESLLDLALEVASQLARSTLRTHKDYLLPIIREAISTLPLHHGHLTLHLNPQDAQHLRPGLAEQLGQNNLQIVDNSDIAPGGCRLVAGTSEVDATIQTRWARILEAIGAEPRTWQTN